MGSVTLTNSGSSTRVVSSAFAPKGQCTEAFVARVAPGGSFSATAPVGALFVVRTDNSALSLKRVLRTSAKSIDIGDDIEVKVTCTGAESLSKTLSLADGETAVISDINVGAVCKLSEVDGDTGFNLQDSSGDLRDGTLDIRARLEGCPAPTPRTKLPTADTCYNEAVFTN